MCGVPQYFIKYKTLWNVSWMRQLSLRIPAGLIINFFLRSYKKYSAFVRFLHIRLAWHFLIWFLYLKLILLF